MGQWESRKWMAGKCEDCNESVGGSASLGWERAIGKFTREWKMSKWMAEKQDRSGTV